MKRNSLFFSFLIIALLLFSCEKEVEQPLDISVSKESVAIAWPMEQDTVLILSPGRNYTVRSTNKTVAEAIIKGDSLFISANDFGIATIELTDEYRNQTDIKVKVHGFKNDVYWFFSTAVLLDDTVDMENIPDSTIVIDPEDCTVIQGDVSDEIKKQIKADVTKTYKWGPFGFLLFDPEKQSFTILHAASGTYSLANRTLDIAYYRTTGATPLFFDGFELVLPVTDKKQILMKVNSTAKYQEMFPGAGITEVITNFSFLQTTIAN